MPCKKMDFDVVRELAPARPLPEQREALPSEPWPLESRQVLTAVVSVTASDAAAKEHPNGQSQDPGEYTFSRSGDGNSGDLVVGFTMGGTATANSDYSVYTTVTIPNGQATVTMPLTVHDDALTEGNETAILTLSSASTYTIGTPSQATVTIDDDEDDPPPSPVVSVSATDGSASEQGTDPGAFTVSRTGSTSASLTVYYSLPGGAGKATSGVDYQTLSGVVVIPASQSTATITVTPIDDNDYEGLEMVDITILDDVAYDLGASSTAYLSLNDNDNPPEVSITATDASATEVVSGGVTGKGTYRFSRTGGTTSAIVVKYNITTGTGQATNGSDYETLSGEVTIPAGQAYVDLDLVPKIDAVVEGNETAQLVLTSNTNYPYSIASGSSSASVTIADDPPVVTVEATTPETAEGSSTPGLFTFRRTGGTESSLTVNFSLDGSTAESGPDYTTISTSVTFNVGSSTATVTIAPNNDSDDEVLEGVLVTLSSNTALYNLGSSSSAAVTIADNDPTTFSIADVTVDEDDAQGFAQVILSIVTDVDYAISYSLVEGSAESPEDYSDDPALNGQLLIPAGQSSGVISFMIEDDQIDEPAQSFSISASQVGGSASDSATVTITDNDDATIFAQVDNDHVNEGDSVTISGQVTTSGSLPSYVEFLLNGDLAGSTSVSTAGTFSRMFTIDDDDPTDTESDELEYTVRTPSGGPSAASATVTITADNVAPIATADVVDPTDENVPMNELDATGGTVRLRINYTDVGVSDTHAVWIDWGDGSTADVFSAGSMSGSQGSTYKDHTYDALPENFTDPQKTYPITVTLADDDGGTITLSNVVVSTLMATGTPPEVWLTTTDSESSEVLQNTGTFDLHRTSTSTTGDLAVRIRITGDADSWADYKLEAVSGTSAAALSVNMNGYVMVTIPNTKDFVTVRLTPKVDGNDTANTEDAVFEIVNYWYYNTPYTIDASNDTSTITIEDGYGQVSIEVIDDEVAEDVNVTRWSSTGLRYRLTYWSWGYGLENSTYVTVPLSYEGTASHNSGIFNDYNAPSSVGFYLTGAGPTTKSFYVIPVADARIESSPLYPYGETVLVNVEPGTGVTPVPLHSFAQGYINDDDRRYLKVELSQESKAETGGGVWVTVSRVGGSMDVETSATLATSGTATHLADYRIQPASESQTMYRVYFPRGVQSQTFWLAINNDSFLEKDESATITAIPYFSSEFDQSLNATANSATLTIMDDDQSVLSGWELVDTPADSIGYKPWRMDDGSDQEWIYNSVSKCWERIKIVTSWKALVTVPYEAGGFGAVFSDDDKFHYGTSDSYQFEISVGGGIELTKTLSGNFAVTPSYTGTSSGSSDPKYDPRHKSASDENTKWGSVPLAKVITYVKQYSRSDFYHAGVTPPPPNGDAANSQVTGEQVSMLQYLWHSTTMSFEPVGDAAMYKHIRQPGEM